MRGNEGHTDMEIFSFFEKTFIVEWLGKILAKAETLLKKMIFGVLSDY